MRRADWLADEARRTLAKAVEAVEARTAAEIVVTVRDRSGSYRHVDFGLGAVLALAILAVYIYYPAVFHDDLAIPSVVLAFFGGLLLGGALDAPKRAFVSRATRHVEVLRAARAEFVEQRISVTRARSGILVYVSLLENDVAVVADVGVDTEKMGVPWSGVVTALEECARRGGSPADFAAALLTAGDPLAAALPITEDDVNELPDAVVA